MIPGEFFPMQQRFPLTGWLPSTPEPCSCLKTKIKLKKKRKKKKRKRNLKAAGCRGFSVSVRIMWQWHSSNRNQKPCNVSPCCLDWGGWGVEGWSGKKKTVRSASGHGSGVAVNEIYEGYKKSVLALRQFDSRRQCGWKLNYSHLLNGIRLWRCLYACETYLRSYS